jgi:hypothetical protein
MLSINRNLLTASLLLSSLASFGWGQKGHDVTAYIAECNLTPATLDSVSSLLDGKSMVYYANWMDNASYTEPYAYTKTWHYKNIDAHERYEDAHMNEKGDIVKALENQISILRDRNVPKDEKALALKMVMHFLGDIHQPMHMGHASDLGGNLCKVNFFGEDSDLHTVWDTMLPEAAHKWSYTEWREQLDRPGNEDAKALVKDGTPQSWGKETYGICSEVYDATPEGTGISYDYVAQWTPVVENQLLKGGLRLADILNSVFDPSYQPLNSFVNHR